MLKLSKLSDYAVVVLVKLGDGSTEAPRVLPNSSAAAVAISTGVPEPTVAKVLKALAVAGIVESRRGARGGYSLARPLTAISVADVIGAIDGPIALTSCVDGRGDCEVGHMCAIRGRWDVVNTAVEAALRAVSMADLADSSVPAAFRLPRSPDLTPYPSLPPHVE